MEAIFVIPECLSMIALRATAEGGDRYGRR
jgi:hypothetical protein